MNLPLLPCPFCGSTQLSSDGPDSSVFCIDCQAMGPEGYRKSHKSAYELWNIRTYAVNGQPEGDLR
jgi:Lar family restriction alleviation protein